MDSNCNFFVFSSSDEDVSSSDTQNHPALQDGWERLSIEQRKQALELHQKSRKASREADRRKHRSESLSKKQFDWSLKPRRSVDVTANRGLAQADSFSTRQAFQLRVAGVCNLLNKVPLWCESQAQKWTKGYVKPGLAGARSIDPDDPFLVKALKQGSSWVVVELDLSHSSR